MANQALFAARGAQPAKASRYKPIWTDRFFTGYATNRSPFRSPLGVYYAEGWGLGKTDTLIDGADVELSPRLTLIRRPGNTAYSSASSPAAPLGFYSFHRQDGVITLVEDTATGVYTVTPSAVTSIYTKTTGAGQAKFCGLGTQLYWGDGTTAKAWDASTPSIAPHQLGISSPTKATGISQFNTVAGTNQAIVGVSLSSGGYVSTSASIANYSNVTMECWIKMATASPANMPLMSFESGQIGASTVYHAIYIDANGFLAYAVRDANTSTANVTTSQTQITDTLWHHIVISVAYSGNIFSAVTYNNGVPISSKSVGSQNYQPDSTLTTNFSFNNTPSISSGYAPHPMQVFFYLDGAQVFTGFPSISLPAITGFWRIGNCSSWSAGPTFVAFNGVIALAAVYPMVVGAVRERFRQMTVVAGYASYVTQVSDAGGAFLWKLNETVGTTAADSIGSNPGTYQATVALNQSSTIQYKPWAATTAVVLNQYVVDSNFNLQKVTAAGTTGGSTPTWATFLGQTTVDGTVSWQNMGPIGLKLTVGTQWAYAYVNKNGHYSTLAPLQVNSGPVTGAALKIIGPVSSDPQVTNVAVFRTPDGGTTPMYLDTINNSYPGNGVWGYTDTSQDSELNVLMPGPQANSNDPAPYGLTNLVYHLGRMWGSVGGVLYASGGPDTLVGNGAEAWPPANSWTLPSSITRMVATNSGLTVFTTSGIWIMAGGPAIYQFYPQLLIDRIGLASYNALDVNGSQIILFTADRQLISLEPSTGVSELGFPIADKLAAFDPTKVYVAHHHNGLDNALYVGDGTTGWYRCCPQQPPDYSISGPVWSPKAAVNRGAFPQGWSNRDIGTYSPAGATTYSSGVWQINSPGSAGFSGTASDTFQFLYQTLNLSSDITLICQLTAYTNTPVSGFQPEVGLIIRQDLTQGSVEASANIELQDTLNGSNNQQFFTEKRTTGGASAAFNFTDSNTSTWIKLTYTVATHTVNAYRSPDGITWTLEDSFVCVMSGTVYAGLCCNEGVVTKTVSVSNLSITGSGAVNNGLGNCGALASVETSPGIYQLMIGGSNVGSSPILVRDSTYGTFVDNGNAYDAFFTVGNVVLANPGEMAELGFITCDFTRVGTSPVTAVLIDEISGAFSVLPNPISDPPTLYGTTLTPATLYANRYYFKSASNPAWCRHLQIKVDYASDAVMNEILSMTIWGSVLEEGV